MHLPSFLWLWRIAAWSMGLAITTFFLLASTGGWVWWSRKTDQHRPAPLRLVHVCLGFTLVSLVLLLLAIGIIGTLGHFGSLGHSVHLPVGLLVVCLTLASAWSAMQIRVEQPWARSLHLGLNLALGCSLVSVVITGWTVVQKYLP